MNGGPEEREPGKSLYVEAEDGPDRVRRSSTSESCDGRGDYTDEVESLIDCDAVYVQSAGNTGSTSGDCTTHFPADHPWTFTVAGFHSWTPCDTAGAYFTADWPFDNDSSMGGRGDDNDVTIIDMTAPYHLGNLIYPDTSPPTWDARSGTSYSCPLVAGLMAEVMDWYKTHYYNALFYNNRMRAFMLLFGDRSAGPDGTTQLSGYYDIRWGAGRVGLIPFDDLDNYSVHRG